MIAKLRAIFIAIQMVISVSILILLMYIFKNKTKYFRQKWASLQIKLLGIEIEIVGKIDNNEYTTYCTMKNNSKFVGIKKGNGYKYPSLNEACKAYGIDFSNSEAHSSDYDALKAYELFMATMKLKNEEI